VPKEGKPVSCERARADLSLEVDGELPAEQSGRLTAHVQACASCAVFRSRLSTIRQGLRFEAVGEVPDVAPRVLATMAARGPRRPSGPAQRWPGLAGSAGC
jgi:anti-sigma factor RsiW